MIIVTTVLTLSATLVAAQALPPHPPLRILITSDEVNPHGLSDAELTQPGELAATLAAIPGLQLDSSQPDPVLEIATDDLDQATTRLLLGPDDPQGYDVLIYFSHRIPQGGVDDQARQEAFVVAVDQFLTAGGGVVAFHHGIYETAGKASMQSILGAAATGAVTWNTTEGQSVIAVADHFVTRYGVGYSGTTSYQDAAHGVALDDYPVFNNTPDERYPTLSLEPDSEEIEILFASDYLASPHVLGFTHHRDAWNGIVVVYQPGEHQPTALEPGNNLQILLNAVIYAARYREGELLFGDGFESADTTLWSP